MKWELLYFGKRSSEKNDCLFEGQEHGQWLPVLVFKKKMIKTISLDVCDFLIIS